jgi:hypothetical protein
MTSTVKSNIKSKTIKTHRLGLAILIVALIASVFQARSQIAALVMAISQEHNQAQNSHTVAPTYSAGGAYVVTGPPSISPQFINVILCTWRSPTCGQGQALYDYGVQYGIDPVFALAFFMNESTFGTQGEARITLALGNERCIADRPCVNTAGGACQRGQSCYAQFYSWVDGFQHWYMLIRNLYVDQWRLTTVDQIIPRYAPNGDGNNDQHYIAVIKRAVDLWRAGKVALS